MKNWNLPWHQRLLGEELQQFSLEQRKSVDMLVFGRVTYEGMAAYCQSAHGAMADYMNSLPKVVCAQTLQAAAQDQITPVKDNVEAEIASLKQQGHGNMFVFGGASLSRALMNENLFDKYCLGIAPVIYRRGRFLFHDGLNSQELRLHEARLLSNGCVILRYLAEGVA